MKKIILFLIVITFLTTSFSIAKSDNLNNTGPYMGVHYYDYTERTTKHDPFMTLKTAIPTGTKWIVNGMEPMNETLEIGIKFAF